jgi:hypothetical protein
MRPGFPVCVLLSSLRFISAQETQEAPLQPTVVTIKIGTVEGDGAINSIRLRRAHEPVVRVMDSGGEPLSGATVTFLLPATGPSGSFLDGGLSLTTQTDSQGQAVGRGLRPNSIAGEFRIRVTASWSGSQGAATLVQTNAEPVVKPARSKTIVIVAIIAGAVAVGAAIAARGGKSSPAESAATASVAAAGSISPGAPSFGPPH